jgi:hypothetical protein
MHQKMLERNAQVFLEKRKKGKGDDWIKPHMRVRFSADESKNLVLYLRSLKDG